MLVVASLRLGFHQLEHMLLSGAVLYKKVKMLAQEL